MDDRGALALDAMYDRIDELEAENDRLRAALEELIGAAEHCGDGDAPVVLRARLALQQQGAAR